MTAPVDVLAVIDRARDVLMQTYAKYQTKIGPFASQSQRSNVELRQARAAVVELIDAMRDMLALQEAMMREANHANSCYQASTFAAMNNAPLRARVALDRVGGAA